MCPLSPHAYAQAESRRNQPVWFASSGSPVNATAAEIGPRLPNDLFVGKARSSEYHTSHPLRYSVRKYRFASGALVSFSFFASQRIFLPARKATLPSNTASVSEPA